MIECEIKKMYIIATPNEFFEMRWVICSVYQFSKSFSILSMKNITQKLIRQMMKCINN